MPSVFQKMFLLSPLYFLLNVPFFSWCLFHVVYGDMGILYNNYTLQLLNQLLDNDDLDVVLHMGDISYADDRNPPDYETVWNIFFDEIEGIASRIPYMVCPVRSIAVLIPYHSGKS